MLVKYPNGTRSTEPKITGIAKMTDICPEKYQHLRNKWH